MRSAALLLATTALLCSACGHSELTATRSAPTRAATPAAASGPALGLTEDDADLLWNPQAAPDGPFSTARSELTALHPTYLRLLIDWAALQPSAQHPPDLEAAVSGCARESGPCGAFAGVRAELAAIASQQRAAGPQAFQVVIDILGVPAWAAAEPSGCELPGTSALALALRSSALGDYRALIGSLLKLAAQEGVALDWWSPWNEPNDPRFLSPQRASCSAGSPPISVRVYGELAGAMSEELRSAGAGAHMILGELQGLTRDSPHTTSIAQFVANLPEEVACLGSVWSVHAYASYGAGAGGREPVQALRSALAARGGCASRAPIWVTEAGTGAPHAGQPRAPGVAAEDEGCEALARELARWYSDPDVGAVFQYTFREDPDFQVGLVSANLDHLYPAYGMWLQYSQRRRAGEPPPAPGEACRGG
jgi:hypothetical protein